MNGFSYLYMAAVIQGILLCLGLVTRKTSNRRSNLALATIILVLSLELLFSWASASGYNQLPGAFPLWRLNTYLAIPPSILLFFQSHLWPNRKWARTGLAMYAPAVLQLAVNLGWWDLFPQSYYAIFRKPLINRIWYHYSETLPLLATAIVLGWVGVQLYRKKTDRVGATRGKWLRRLLAVYLSLFALFILWVPVVLFDASLFRFMEPFLVGCLFALGYLAYFNPDYFERKMGGTRAAVFPAYDDEQELSRLRQLFDRQLIYRRAKLSVADVAGELKLPIKYVSYLVVTRLETNFTDFVNGYRVRDVISRMPLEKNKNLLGIALDAGFNSKSSFNFVFKKTTGRTPSDYFRGKN